MRSLTRLLVIFTALSACVLASFDFTNIKIKSTDDSFAIVAENRLQAVNRSLKLYNLRIKMLQLPVNNAKVNYVLLKRSNGYQPYNINYTVDICKFFRNSNHLLNNYIYSFFKDYTNCNHTCPFNHDVLIKQFPTHSLKTMTLLPIPKGDYALETVWFAYGKARLEMSVYFTFS